MGYTTDYVVGAWTGNDKNSQMVDVTGIMGAAPIWHYTMLLLEQGRPIQNFAGPPPGVMKRPFIILVSRRRTGILRVLVRLRQESCIIGSRTGRG